jgi:tetratricopeptide (TPR) repeat protein
VRLALIALVVLAGAACGARQPARPRPIDEVKREIEIAEDAERQREHEAARAHYEVALTKATDPESLGFARREYGETLATWGENEAARTQLEGSVAAVPGDPLAWQMLGILRAKLGDLPGAFAALEKSKSLAPRAWIPRRDLAVLHWSRGEGRTADPDPTVAARHRAAALAEYKAMLDLDLPDRVREKVLWAIDVLSKAPGAAVPPPS